MAVMVSRFPYYSTIVLTLLYLVFCLVVGYLVPQCSHIDDEGNVSKVGCAADGSEDDKVLAFSTDVFITVLTFGQATHLLYTTNHRILCCLVLMTLSFGFLLKGVAHKFSGRTSSGAGIETAGFLVTSLFQYLLWTASTVFVGFLVHAAGGLLHEEARTCWSIVSKIAGSFNVLSALVLVCGCFWGALNDRSHPELVGIVEYLEEKSTPIHLFRIGQLAWHGSSCLFLVSVANVLGALAKQVPTKFGGLPNCRAASGLILSQLALAGFVIYFSLNDGIGNTKGWAVNHSYNITGTLTNYFMMMSAHFIHNLLYTLFPGKPLFFWRSFSSKFHRDDAQEDTDDCDSSEDGSGLVDVEGCWNDRTSNEERSSFPNIKGEKAKPWLFHIFPLFQWEQDAGMGENPSTEDDMLVGPGGTKIVIRNVSSLSTRNQSSFPTTSPSQEIEEPENLFSRSSFECSREKNQEAPELFEEVADHTLAPEIYPTLEDTASQGVIKHTTSSGIVSSTQIEAPGIEVPITDDDTAQLLDEKTEIKTTDKVWSKLGFSRHTKDINTIGSIHGGEQQQISGKGGHKEKILDPLSQDQTSFPRRKVHLDITKGEIEPKSNKESQAVAFGEGNQITVESVDETELVCEGGNHGGVEVERIKTASKMDQSDSSLAGPSHKGDDDRNEKLKRFMKRIKKISGRNLDVNTENNCGSNDDLFGNSSSCSRKSCISGSHSNRHGLSRSSSNVSENTIQECQMPLNKPLSLETSESILDPRVEIEVTFEEAQKALNISEEVESTIVQMEEGHAGKTPSNLKKSSSREVETSSTSHQHSNNKFVGHASYRAEAREMESAKNGSIDNFSPQSMSTVSTDSAESSSSFDSDTHLSVKEESFHTSLLHVLNPFENDEIISDSSISEYSSVEYGVDSAGSFESSKCSEGGTARGYLKESCISVSASESASEASVKKKGRMLKEEISRSTSSSGLKLTWSAFERQSPCRCERPETDQSYSPTGNRSLLSKHRRSNTTKT